MFASLRPDLPGHAVSHTAKMPVPHSHPRTAKSGCATRTDKGGCATSILQRPFHLRPHQRIGNERRLFENTNIQGLFGGMVLHRELDPHGFDRSTVAIERFDSLLEQSL